MHKLDTDTTTRQKNRIIRVATGLLALFGALAVYLAYIQIWQAPALDNNIHNRRSYYAAVSVRRGTITDRNGVVLAESELAGNGKYRRVYEGGRAFANITGYFSQKYGKTGIEAQYDQLLSGADNPFGKFGPVSRLWQTGGADIELTIDAAMQRDAYNALGVYNGAVVALNPQTGEILVFVSKPSYDSNSLNSNWDSLINDKSSPLLDRAAQGLYPPGSTYKALMAIESLYYGVIDESKRIDCRGVLKIGNYDLIDDNHEVHGDINIKDALIESCNIFFGQLALDSGRSKMNKYFGDFHLAQSVPDVPDSSPAVLPDLKNLGDGDLAQTGIGQGQLLVTPLQMALITAAIANDGVVMKPHMLSAVKQQGMRLRKIYPQEYFKVADPATAEKVRDMMEAVVKRGTGTSVRIAGYRIGGKTGTAQNPHGQPHSWFIGFAPVDNPTICVAVIAENAGYGAGTAAAVARRIFMDALGGK